MTGLAGCAAFLRVYEPLAAFEGAERDHWTAYLQARKALDRTAGVVLEREAGLLALVGAPPRLLPQLEPHAFVTELDGVTLLCPWSTRRRALEALEDFRATLPGEVAEAFVPAARAERLEAELDRMRAEPSQRVHVLSSTWQVPLRWFVLVEADERHVSLGTAAGSRTTVTGRELVYRTAMSRARRRTAKALDVLRRTVEDGAVTAEVEDLGRWLEEFHPRSLVELDYGGLVHLLDDGELSTDESARDIAAALGALAAGAPAEAAAAYGRVSARMKTLQAVESAS